MKVKIAFIVSVVIVCLIGLMVNTASAQELNGWLQPNQTVNHTLYLNDQNYDVYLYFDSGDVDWTLYDENNNVVAYEAGVDNPDIENNVKPPRAGSYRLEVRNLRAQATNYRIQFRNAGSTVGDTEITVSGKTVQGRLLKAGDESSTEIYLNAGSYTVYCSFDSGDVDWTLYDGGQVVAQEYGVENPDIEQITINRSGNYKLVVRNVRNNSTNFRIEFRTGNEQSSGNTSPNLTFTGTFNKTHMKGTHNFYLNQGTYRVETHFDQGDVDWTLRRGDRVIAVEAGTQNPDIEEVRIPENGNYQLEVRNLNVASYYRVVFIPLGTLPPTNSQTTVDGLTMRGSLSGSGSTAEGTIYLPAGNYRVICSFDSGDVDWTLYEGSKIVAGESGVANPDIEDINIARTGTYRLVAVNISNNYNNFTIQFVPTGSGTIIPGSGQSATVTGYFNKGDSRRNHRINLIAGTYRVTTYFDTGDVDWTLSFNNQVVANEYGTSNPDIEENVSITQSGFYDLEVRNLQNNNNNYRIVFEPIGSTNTTANENINISGNIVTGYLSSVTNRVQGNIFLTAGAYEAVLNFDNGDVDWALYEGSRMVASESGIANPDIENFSLTKTGTYRLEVINISRHNNNFRLEFRYKGSNYTGSNQIKVVGNTVEGVFASNSFPLEQTIYLEKGRYDVYCWFDSGDVDWTLRYNNSYIASESGTMNPDIENNININQSGNYRLEVRNLHGNMPNKFKIEFRKIR